MLTDNDRRLLTAAADTLDDADAAIRDEMALGCDPKAMAAAIRAIVDRPAPTAAPGLDLDAVEREVRDDEIDGLARAYAPALIAEVRALRAEVAERRETASRQLAAIARHHDRISAKLAEAQRLGLEACRASGAAPGGAVYAQIAAIAAALEAL